MFVFYYYDDDDDLAGEDDALEGGERGAPGDRPWPCSRCDGVFTLRASLNRHKARVHGTQAEGFRVSALFL